MATVMGQFYNAMNDMVHQTFIKISNAIKYLYFELII